MDADLSLFIDFRRKQEAVVQHSVFSLLCDRFAAVSPAFTMKAYNAFFEVRSNFLFFVI